MLESESVQDLGISSRWHTAALASPPPSAVLPEALAMRRQAVDGRRMRGIQLAQLTAFVATARHLSFTRAAVQLGVSVASLSEAVSGLERMLRVRLLNRTTRSVALTEAGEHVLNHLCPALEGLEMAVDAVNAFRDSPAGMLRLSLHPIAAATVIAPLLARFAAKYPAIRLDISIEGTCRDIVGERFDAGIHFGTGIPQDMIAVPIGEKFRLATVASPEYLARCAPPSVPNELRAHNCIRQRLGVPGSGETWTFTAGSKPVEVAVEGSMIVNDLDLVLRAALGGIGVAQLPPMYVASHVAEGRLVPLLVDFRPPPSGCSLFYSSRRHVPAKLRALIDFLRREAKHPDPDARDRTLQ